MSRREIAAQILLKMLDSPGNPSEKVHAAVVYTDKLLSELGESPETNGNGSSPLTREKGSETLCQSHNPLKKHNKR